MASAYPQTLCDRARRLTGTYGLCVAAEILHINRVAIWRMKQRGWRQGHPGRQRPRPSDFAIQSAHMCHNELRRHYGAASGTVTRWRREIGK